MDIILVSGKLAKARTYTVSLPQLALLALACMGALAALTTALNVTLLKYAVELNLPSCTDFAFPRVRQRASTSNRTSAKA